MRNSAGWITPRDEIHRSLIEIAFKVTRLLSVKFYDKHLIKKKTLPRLKSPQRNLENMEMVYIKERKKKF